MKLMPENTALIVVDMQERFAPAVHDFETVSAKTIQLCTAAKLLNLSVVVSEQYPKGLGPTVEQIKSNLPETASVIEKSSFSCFGEENFRKALIQQKKNTLLICGIESHICVLQTALDAQERGYAVTVIADAVGSRRESDRNTALDFLRTKGISVLSLESVLFLLLQDASHPALRQIQKIIK